MRKPQALSVEYQTNPVGVAASRPMLMWTYEGEGYGAAQSAFRVQVSSAEGNFDASLVWDSGRVESRDNRLCYPGPAAGPNEKRWWRVALWDENGQPGPWSDAASWRQGLAPDDWRGEWIGWDEGREAYDPATPYYCADDFDKGRSEPFLPKPALLRREFHLRDEAISAQLYLSAYGLAKVWINGREASRGHLVPGLCDYRKRVYAFGWEAEELLRPGANAVSAVLADGWYAGYIGLNPRQWWGAKPRLLLELRVRYRDGSEEVFASDGKWRGCVGPWLYADIMHGAGYDATLEPVGWKLPGYDDAAWHPVLTDAEYPHRPQMHPGVPIVEHARYAPVSIRRIGADEAIVDFGRCFSGVVRARLQGPRGARVDFVHAEELKRDGGGLYLYGNRSARCHDRYILSGEGEEIFQPEFTYRGFRYVQISGLAKAKLLSIEGVAISSALPGKTALTSGHPVIGDVVEMLRNTEQSNFMDMPTDVSTRDERLGWGADGHFFLHTAVTLNHSALFIRKWLRDALDGQGEDGRMWAIAPAVMMKDISPFAGDLQSDMALHCAWLLAKWYGDFPAVREAFPALERYFACSLRNSDRLVRFATARDWLDLGPDGHSDRDHGYGHCDPALIGTAWFARSARMMEELAAFLGEDARVSWYREMYQKIRGAFRTFFLGRNLLLRGASQGGYLMAAAFDLIEGAELQSARDWVLRDMERAGGITWGTSSAAIALQGLRRLGLEKQAAAFLASERYPSYGYMRTQGATTVWERWDGIYEGVFFPHPMNAFDHIGLAAAGGWILTGLVGLEPAAPGFERVRIRPVLDPAIGSMRARYESPRGPIEISWTCSDNTSRLEAALPPGVAGEVLLPFDKNEIRILRGREGIGEVRCADGLTRISLTSGAYGFIIDSTPF